MVLNICFVLKPRGPPPPIDICRQRFDGRVSPSETTSSGFSPRRRDTHPALGRKGVKNLHPSLPPEGASSREKPGRISTSAGMGKPRHGENRTHDVSSTYIGKWAQSFPISKSSCDDELILYI